MQFLNKATFIGHRTSFGGEVLAAAGKYYFLFWWRSTSITISISIFFFSICE